MRGSDRGEMRAEGTGFGILGISKAAAQRVETRRTRGVGLSHEGKLLEDLHTWSHRCGLSRSGVVSFLHAGGSRKNHSGAFDWGTRRRGICIRKKSVN